MPLPDLAAPWLWALVLGAFALVLVGGVTIGLRWGRRRALPVETADYARLLDGTIPRLDAAHDGLPLRATYDADALSIRLTLPRAARGSVALAGPSDDAASSLPEAKLRVGDGLFDAAFWVRREAPPGATAQMLLNAPDARAALLAAPFGLWAVAERSASYTRADARALTADDLLRATDALAAFARAAAGR